MAYQTNRMSDKDRAQFHKAIAGLQSAQRRKDRTEIKFYQDWLNNYFKPKYWVDKE